MKKQMISVIIAVSIVLALVSCDELINEGIDNQNRKHEPTKILFAKYNTDWELYEINPDGTGEKRLTYLPSSNEYCGSWSPDGEYIVFVSNMTGLPEVYFAKADMTHVEALTSDGASTVTWPSWSPDGTKIAFISDKGGLRQVYVMDKYGNDVRRVTTNAFIIYTFSWGIDSKHICYDGSGLHVINIDGTGDYAISGTSSFAGPTYSPDGKYIYVQESPINYIWRMNSDGTNQINLTGSHGNSSHGHVVLSPDGSQIFYMADTGSGIHIFRWIDYTNAQQMTFTGTDNEYLAFKVR